MAGWLDDDEMYTAEDFSDMPTCPLCHLIFGSRYLRKLHMDHCHSIETYCIENHKFTVENHCHSIDKHCLTPKNICPGIACMFRRSIRDSQTCHYTQEVGAFRRWQANQGQNNGTMGYQFFPHIRNLLQGRAERLTDQEARANQQEAPPPDRRGPEASANLLNDSGASSQATNPLGSSSTSTTNNQHPPESDANCSSAAKNPKVDFLSMSISQPQSSTTGALTSKDNRVKNSQQHQSNTGANISRDNETKNHHSSNFLTFSQPHSCETGANASGDVGTRNSQGLNFNFLSMSQQQPSKTGANTSRDNGVKINAQGLNFDFLSMSRQQSSTTGTNTSGENEAKNHHGFIFMKPLQRLQTGGSSSRDNKMGNSQGYYIHPLLPGMISPNDPRAPNYRPFSAERLLREMDAKNLQATNQQAFSLNTAASTTSATVNPPEGNGTTNHHVFYGTTHPPQMGANSSEEFKPKGKDGQASPPKRAQPKKTANSEATSTSEQAPSANQPAPEPTKICTNFVQLGSGVAGAVFMCRDCGKSFVGRHKMLLHVMEGFDKKQKEAARRQRD